MLKKNIIVLIVLGLVVGASIGVMTWWLLRADNLYETIQLEGDGIGNVPFTAAMTRIEGKGNMFWWFYPTLANTPTSRPILLWLNGVTGIPPSFLANFGMFGPYDTNLSRRNESWVDDYNLLFIDAPLGTGFSTSEPDNNELPGIEENVEHILRTIQSFYDLHEAYRDTTIYICGHADGSQLAVLLAKRLYKEDGISEIIKGIILGNPILSPALVLTKLGFYLEELAYIDGDGRTAIENFSNTMNRLVQSGAYPDAFEQFATLGNFVNSVAGAVAVNINHIVEKLTRESSQATQDFFKEKIYLQRVLRSDFNVQTFMDDIVAPALGIPETNKYDEKREAAIQAFKPTFMKPLVEEVEYILENTNLTVNIYNGNLDAVSNTPGQLEWINTLEWSGQTQFLNEPRETIIINRQIEGYFRESERLRFYWINVAGQLVPLDSPVAIRRVIGRIVN